jgi:mevalonate kinase
MPEYRSNGKLLITGEYFVLNGATALVLPLKFGQSLSVKQMRTEKPLIYWDSDQYGRNWFHAKFSKYDFSILETTDRQIAKYLRKIFQAIGTINSEIFKSDKSLLFNSNIEFNRDWGWGSSSTLLVNLARWADVNPPELNSKITNGSGYDILAAMNQQPFLFNRKEGNHLTEQVILNPSITDHIYFVYLGIKQKSRNEVIRYRKLGTPAETLIHRISEMSRNLAWCSAINEFNELIKEHEQTISNYIHRDTIQKSQFADFQGTVKSLGAWGGDFIMMTCTRSKEYLSNYLLKKGFDTFFTFNEIALINL